MVKRLSSVSVVAAVVCSIAAAPALTASGYAAAAARSASVGALRFSYRFAHLVFPRGVLVADYQLSLNSPTVRSATFPASGVVFELEHEPKLQPPIAAPAVRFPLSLANLGRSTRHANGQTWELRFRAKGSVYWAIVWLGKSARDEDRAAVTSIVSSIRRA
ncbi:MAG TPA: hypothetical protein VJ375_13660 [Gaiellaceae bacterium]|nr:hypothetical protein [Gaiellaceae bacterium]